jgi:hypothetical protein
MFVIQITSSIMSRNHMNNLFLSHYYFILQYTFLSAFYYFIHDNKNFKKIIKFASLLIFITLTVQYIINPKVFFKFNLMEINLTSITLITFSVFYFISSLNEKKPFPYINSGIFIYLLSSILIFSAGNLMRGLDRSVNRIIWSVNALLYLIFQILVCIEWYKNYRVKQTYE